MSLVRLVTSLALALCVSGTVVPLACDASLGSTHAEPEIIFDVAFIPRVYYFVADHPIDLDEATLMVWRDDAIQSNNIGTYRGLARLDATLPPDATNPELQGNFDLLRPNVDYTVIYRWTDGSTEPQPVIQLLRQLFVTELLAVTYSESTEPPKTVGSTSWEPDSVLVKPGDTFLLQAVAIRSNNYEVDDNGMFDPEGPWYPLLSHELRNYYDLRARNIPMNRLRITIRKISPGEIDDPNRVFDKPYLEHLGLDQNSEVGPGVPDGFVDSEFVDPVTGILFFPDHRPFDPSTTNAGCPSGKGGVLCLDDFERNILRRSHPEQLAQSNPYVYDRPIILPAQDVRFYMEVIILPPPAPPVPGAVLHQNAPNPFNPETTIRFELNTSERVRITVVDVQGRVVARLLNATLPAGPHQVSWSGLDESGRAVASGVYVYRLEAPSSDVSRKMVLAR